MAEVNEKWDRLANKLRKAVQELKDAQKAHRTAVDDATAALAAAEDKLAAAIDDATELIEEVSETPPGTFPAITD